MSNNQLQRAVFFTILVTFLAISLFANFSFLMESGGAEKLRNLLREKAGFDIQKKAINENPAIYDYFMSLKFKNNTEKIDSLRSWVFENHSRQIDESYSYSFNTSKLLEDMYLFSQKKLNKKPGITTYPSILVLQRLCEFFKLESRISTVMFHEPNSKEIGFYVYLEVLNPDTRNWEIVDPVNNTYYLNSINKKRLNTFTIKALPRESIIVCIDNSIFTTPNAQISPIFDLNDGMFELFILTDESKKSTAILNSEYFEKDLIYTFDQNDKRKMLDFVGYCKSIITY